jgi:magnesium-transporting ATPase (P-type)
MRNEFNGLNENEVRVSLEKWGDNSLKRVKKKGFLRRFFENLGDPIIKILIIALTLEVIFTLGNCNYFEIFGIIAAILISTTVSTVSEYKSEEAFERLNSTSDGTASVIRSGKKQNIPTSAVVKGDIIFISSGEKVPADGPVLSGQVSCDQSALNGESTECSKVKGDDGSYSLSNKNMLFRGSLITEGSAIMRADRIGEETYFGMVASDVQAETRDSPLKIRLNKLAGQISKIGYLVVVVPRLREHPAKSLILSVAHLIRGLSAHPFSYHLLQHAILLHRQLIGRYVFRRNAA